MGNQEFETPQAALAHYGKLGMHWGIRNDGKPGSTRGPAGAKPKPVDVDAMKKGMSDFLATKTHAEIQADGIAKLKDQQAQTFPSRKNEKQQQKADVVQKAADELGAQAKELEDRAATRPPGIRGTLQRANDLGKAQEFRSKEAQMAKKADQIREGKLTDNQKILIGVGAAIAVGGLVAYGNNKYKDQKFGVTKDSKQNAHEENLRKTNAEWNAIFGTDHPGKASKLGYGGALGHGGFHTTLSNKSAWDIPEFTIPEGTVFQRLSGHPEDVSGYGKPRGAYATWMTNDKKLYGSSFEFGSSGHTVTFHGNKGGTRVASLPTIMSHLAHVQPINPDTNKAHDEKSLSQLYYTIAGGKWQSGVSIKLLDSLKTSGYGAIVDHMDAGFMGDLPVVFFGDASRGTSTPRTAKEQHLDSQGLLKVSGTYK